MTIEERVTLLESELFNLKSVVYDSKVYSQNVQKNVISNADKQAETDKGIRDSINDTNTSIANITPYMDMKRAYIGDSSVVFPARSGKITAYAETDNGLVINTQVARNGNNIIVTFEPLDDVATVTISII